MASERERESVEDELVKAADMPSVEDEEIAPGAEEEEIALEEEEEEDPDVADLRDRLAEDPDDPARNSELALALAERGRLLEALPYLQRVTELEPESARAQYNLGVAHFMVLRADAEAKADWAEDHLGAQEHYLAAQQAFLAALELDPSLDEAQTNLDVLSQLDLTSL